MILMVRRAATLSPSKAMARQPGPMNASPASVMSPRENFFEQLSERMGTRFAGAMARALAETAVRQSAVLR